MKQIRRRSFLSRTVDFKIIGLFLAFILLTAQDAECSESDPALRDKTFHLAMNRPEGTPYFTYIELIYGEVFKRLDIKLEIEYLPLKRASITANNGGVDGEPARIHSYNTFFTNLIRIEEPIFPMAVVAYSHDPSIPRLNGWSSLKNTDYRIEYPRGMKICENNLNKVVRPDLLAAVNETKLGLRKLVYKFSDVYIDDHNSILPVLHNDDYELQGKVFYKGTMEIVPLYMYIHKKHHRLVLRLKGVIKEIKSEGLIEKYRKMAFGVSND